MYAGDIYSFEDGNIPSDFKVTKGNLLIKNNKGKLGDKSLQWNWQSGDVFSASPASMRTPSVTSTGGITVWIYNENPVNANLTLRFYEFETSTPDRSCKIDFNLNFKGWRCLWARFRPDMSHTGYTLRHMKWEAPQSGSGTILIDYLEFVDNVSWERISDMQYTLKNSSTELEDFVAARNSVPNVYQTTVSQQQREAIATIKQRLDEWFYGSGSFSSNADIIKRKNAFNTYSNNAVKKISQINLSRLPDGTVNGEGLYPMDFYSQSIDGVSVKTFRDYNEGFMVQLAYDAIVNNNVVTKNLVLDMYDWYYDQGFADGSGLGRLRFEMLRSSGYYYAFYMLRDKFSSEQLNRIINANKWFTLYGKMFQTPENKGEIADHIRALMLPKLFTVLCIPNENERIVALTKFVDYVNNALALAPGYLGTFKPDYSGYHHRGPYYNAYYSEALYVGSLIYYLLADTPFALSDDTYNNLKNGLKTYAFICADYDVPAGIVGRFPTQTQNLDKILPAFAYLALSTPQPDSELTSIFKNLWQPNQEPMKSFVSRVKSDITFKNTIGEVEKMVQLDAVNMITEPLPVGSKILPYSGLFVARQNNWSLRVKGFSKYIWDFETSSSENLYGRYLSYGQVEVARLNSNIRSYQPAEANWDWSHIPGTTVKYMSKEELNASLYSSKNRNFSDDPFLGGVVFDDKIATFSNSMHDNAFDKSFYAKKSVFRFDSLYYCIGSGIKNANNGYSVHTTLFQNLKNSLNDDINVNGSNSKQNHTNLMNPILQDNYNNTYVVLDGKVSIEHNNSFITAYIDQGKAFSDGKYAYTIILNTNRNETQQQLQEMSSSVEILQNSVNAHALFQNTTQTLAVSVFNPNNFSGAKKLIRVDKPSVIIMQESENYVDLAFSDPDMYRPSASNNDNLTPEIARTESQTSAIEIEIQGMYKKIQDDTISIYTEFTPLGNTIIRYNKLKDGKTYKVRLIKNDKLSVTTTDNSCFKLYRGSNSYSYLIENEDNMPFGYNLFNTSGNLLYAENNLNPQFYINLNNYPNGIYLLKLTQTDRNVTFKLYR
ncbi:chondroitinase family polysaccharide lyase [Paludibacter sp.]